MPKDWLSWIPQAGLAITGMSGWSIMGVMQLFEQDRRGVFGNTQLPGGVGVFPESISVQRQRQGCLQGADGQEQTRSGD